MWYMENALLLTLGTDIMGAVNVAGNTVQFNDTLELLVSQIILKHVTNVVRICTFKACELPHIHLLLTLRGS